MRSGRTKETASGERHPPGKLLDTLASESDGALCLQTPCLETERKLSYVPFYFAFVPRSGRSSRLLRSLQEDRPMLSQDSVLKQTRTLHTVLG